MVNTSQVALAIDIGGSKFVVGLVDINGNVLCKSRHLWTALSKEQMLIDIEKAVHDLLKSNNNYIPTVGGATIPGLADSKAGLWLEASFSGIKDWPVAEIFKQKFNLDFYVDNDTNACAFAEKHYGACKDSDDFIWITVSNGIGGAVFINNSLYYGVSGNAGEIGHMIVEDDAGFLCKCGSSGCLEVHAAGPAIVKNYFKLGGKHLINNEIPTALSIANLAKQNDKIAIATYNLEGKYLGKAIAACVNILNPHKVVIGGGVSSDFNLFEASLLKEVDKRIYKNANKKLQIVQTQLGYDAALIGAAVLAFKGNKLI